MIYFKCVHCRQELEAEASARGEKMTCPECRGAVEVPERGIRPSVVESASGQQDLPGSRFLLIAAGLGFAGFLLFLVGGYALMKHLNVGPNLPKCETCDGSGATRCGGCNESGNFTCAKCGGSGTHLNVYDEPELCYICGGVGRVSCSVCGGTGKYSCAACKGTGVIGGKPSVE